MLLKFQIENCVIFIDYGDVSVIVKLSKWKWLNTTGNRAEAATKTANSNKNLDKNLDKRWHKVFEYLKVSSLLPSSPNFKLIIQRIN